MTIPANTTATVRLPVGDPSYVTEGCGPLRDAAGGEAVRPEDGRVTIAVASGSYEFRVPYAPADAGPVPKASVI